MVIMRDMLDDLASRSKQSFSEEDYIQKEIVQTLDQNKAIMTKIHKKLYTYLVTGIWEENMKITYDASMPYKDAYYRANVVAELRTIQIPI
jgi:hypothetical protein